MTCSLFLREENAVKGGSATTAFEIQVSAVSSKTAPVDSMLPYGVAGSEGIARLAAGSMRVVTEASALLAGAALSGAWP